jgi:hypothetical protein
MLRTGEMPLWRSRGLIQGRFAQDYNRHGSLGGLWQERNEAKITASQTFFGQVLATSTSTRWPPRWSQPVGRGGGAATER